MKLSGLFQRGFAFVVSLILALAFLGCGLLTTFVWAPQQFGLVREIEGLQALDEDGFRLVSYGQPLLINGTLTGNEALELQLVAYDRQEWQVEYDDEEGYEGDWETIESRVPALIVEIPGGTIRTAPAGDVVLHGKQYTQVVQRGRGPGEADGIREGTIRLAGYRNGDLVTVVGIKDPQGRLAPNRIFGGERQGLIDELRGGAWLITVCGAGMIVISPVLFLLGRFGQVRAKSRIQS